MYDAARQRLEQRYSGPSTNDLLLNIGSALLKPTMGGTFGESLGNLPDAFLQHAQDRRAMDLKRGDREDELLLAEAKGLGDLDELEMKYLIAAQKAAAAGAKPVRLSFDQLGRARHPYYGSIIKEPPQAAVDALAANRSEERRVGKECRL